MKVLVIYESIFGNTQKVAEAIASGIAAIAEVDTIEVAEAPAEVTDYALVVVGGPTHAWSMSRPITRQSGREQAEEQHIDPASDTIGIREWLDAVAQSRGTPAAAFDTGVGKIAGFVPAGSAARKAADRLVDKGFRLVAEPEQFLVQVQGQHTVLKDGEERRAKTWGERIGQSLANAL